MKGQKAFVWGLVALMIVGCQGSGSGGGGAPGSGDNSGLEDPDTPNPTPTPVPSPTPGPGTPSPTPTPEPSPTPPTPGPMPNPTGKPASIRINGGAARTKASSLSLELETVEGWKMKISESADCSGGTWENYSAAKTWTLGQRNRQVRLSVVFQDYDGVASRCGSASILHDDQGPRITLTPDPANTYLEGDRTRVEVRVEDPGAGSQEVVCRINGVVLACPLSGGVSVVDLPAQNQGSYQLTVDAKDELGNTSNSQIGWTVGPKYRQIIQNAEIKSQTKVDILLITDNSSSMQYEQQSMANRMSTFISKLQGLDWKIGIATTDPRDIALGDGRLVPMTGMSGTYFLTSSMNPTTAQKVLGDTIQRPETGSGSEQGIYATYRFVERSLNPSDPTNGNFLRSDAAFAAVVISDENESATGSKNIPANLVQFIHDQFSGAKKFVFHSIITKPGDTACAQTNGLTYGTTYVKLSELTGAGTVGGAIIGSVCEADYAGQLSGIGQSIQDMKRVLDLQCAPVGGSNSSVQVNLNGQPYNQRYEVTGLKITFENPLPQGQYRLEYECL